MSITAFTRYICVCVSHHIHFRVETFRLNVVIVYRTFVVAFISGGSRLHLTSRKPFLLYSTFRGVDELRQRDSVNSGDATDVFAEYEIVDSNYSGQLSDQ